jgi:hypothetical protein
MSTKAMTGLTDKQAKGAAMEAHAGTITIGTQKRRKPRAHRLAQFRARMRERRVQRAERAYSIRTSGIRAPSIPGSEHSHLLRRHRGF